jgi:hypothetical protein
MSAVHTARRALHHHFPAYFACAPSQRSQRISTTGFFVQFKSTPCSSQKVAATGCFIQFSPCTARKLQNAVHVVVPTADAFKIGGGGGARRSASEEEHGWKFAIFGAAGGLLYLHRRWHQEDLIIFPHSSKIAPEVESLESLDPIVRPPEFKHPFEDLSLVRRAWLVVRRVLKLVFVFAPILAASSLLPILSENASFKGWYLKLLVRTMEDAGASFQKLGQWLSMRPDIFDQTVIQALSSLRDDGPRHSFAHTRQLLEEAFGCPVDLIFEHLEEDPAASGSVAQVRGLAYQ